jgi:hypothetical protein
VISEFTPQHLEIVCCLQREAFGIQTNDEQGESDFVPCEKTKVYLAFLRNKQKIGLYMVAVAEAGTIRL